MSTSTRNGARVGELITELLLALGFLPAASTKTEPGPALPTEPEPPVPFTTVKAAAEALHVSASYLYKHKEELPFMIRFPGGTWRVDAKALRAYRGEKG
ncbi:MAG: DNA-binding protein [Acidobacteria bacterium]|nr:MAG: DNA-binding protein [Acidobacteriota bacterium]